jgi:drug/metabolite transporter (DMT)-like permease
MTVLGAAIAFVSAVGNAVALVLQAMEARNSPRKDCSGLRLLLLLARRPRWVLGTLLLVGSWPCQIVALGFAPITVVQPMLSSFQLVLLGLGHFWLKERTTWREWGGALGIVGGVSVLIIAAPRRAVLHPSVWRLAPPLTLLVLAILTVHLVARANRRRADPRSFTGLDLTIGAGLGYAWTDLVDKLVSNNLYSHHLVVAGLWLITVIFSGALALTYEQSALQLRPASEVGPLVGALQEPLPVVLALWGGLEAWQGGAGRAAALALGLALVGAGATLIARSPVIATVTEDRSVAPPGDDDPPDSS